MILLVSKFAVHVAWVKDCTSKEHACTEVGNKRRHYITGKEGKNTVGFKWWGWLFLLCSTVEVLMTLFSSLRKNTHDNSRSLFLPSSSLSNKCHVTRPTGLMPSQLLLSSSSSNKCHVTRPIALMPSQILLSSSSSNKCHVTNPQHWRRISFCCLVHWVTSVM